MSAALAFIAALLAAPAEGRAAWPPLAPQKPLRMPDLKRVELPGGMRLTLVPYGRVPKVSVQLVVRTGTIDEAPAETWLSNLTAAALLEGTAARDAARLAAAAADLGGRLASNADTDRTTISGSGLSESAGKLVELIAEIARAPRFDEADVARKRADLERQLTVSRSQPNALANERFRALLYGDHPYARTLPKADELHALSAAQVRAFWTQNAGARRAHLYVAGVFDEAAVEAAARAAFAGWSEGAPPASRPPAPTAGRRVHLIDRPGAPQSTIYFGLPVVDPSSPDAIALDVADTLLGGAFGSRITRNIREDKGYTYSPFSFVSARPHDAYWIEIADVTTKDTAAALREIIGEMQRLRREPPPLEELEGTRAYMTGQFQLQLTSRDGILRNLQFLDLHALPLGWMERFAERVEAVTPEEARRVADRYLRDDQCALVVVGDAKLVREQLAAFGDVQGP